MSKPIRFGSAVSLVALASMTASCAAPQGRVAGASHFGGKTNDNVGLATRALAALNSNNIPIAIDLAERAVDKTPDDAGFRGLLGNAYFAGGRFASAEAAYKDALAIYSNQPQVVLKLALAEIAQGKTAEALAFLDGGRSILDPADYGLALALAGRAAFAIPTLEAAARQQGADARVRQNLALAYAFAGDWNQARTIAAQDVPGNQLDARIQQWMQLAKPARPSDQVASLTGVTPVALDPGQPTRLALRRTDTRLAQAAPAPAPAPVATPPSAPQPQAAKVTSAPVAATQPRFVAAIAAPAARPAPVPAIQPAPPPRRQPQPVIALSPAPITVAMAAAASPEAPAAFAVFAPKMTALVAKPAKVRHASAPARPAPIRSAALRRGNSSAVVQLGAYGSQQRVVTAWNAAARRYAALRAYMPMSARFTSPRGIVYRLAVKGFVSDRDARLVCESLRRSGGSCFVRNVAGDAPVQFASR